MTFFSSKKFNFMKSNTQATVPVYGAVPPEAGLPFLCLMTRGYNRTIQKENSDKFS